MDFVRFGFLAFTLAGSLLSACSKTEIEASAGAHGGGQVVHWGYEAEDGPAKWVR